MNPEDNTAIIAQFQQGQRQVQKFALKLRFQGHAAEAEQVEKKLRELNATIDLLLAQAMTEWRGDGAAARAQLKEAHGELRVAIDYIARKRKIADNVAKVLGKLDEIIETGRGLLA